MLSMDAIKGAGTDETTLIEIICSQSNKGIIEIKEEYKIVFGRDLEKDVKGDTGGDFKKFMVAMLQGTREENQQLDQEAAERDADLLIKAGPKKWGTDEETFSMIFARRSFVQLRAIVLHFEAKTGKLMEKMIESETRKELCSAYKTVVKLAKNPGNYFASRIHKGMKGAGTDEDTVIWNLIFTSEMCLENVKTEFEKLTKQSLEKAIKSEFRGDAEKLLLAVCKGNR
ncbi:unnamed protein product [Oikopleura dioica]|uniref:Annexin n=1 Tax=Oikopleura dioica TaxID=34765 RepID=E4XKK2_OIKDI|nr:unnamed protein product [Oikopleura dioica]